MSGKIDIRFPEEQSEGTTSVLSNWLKQAGDTVRAHEPIAEIETDKVVMEIAAPADGSIESLLKQPGDSVGPGELLATMRSGSAAVETPAAAGPVSSARSDGLAQARPERLSPAVRRLAAEHSLDLGRIRGTGSQGRITVADVRLALANRNASTDATPAAAQFAAPDAAETPLAGSRTIPLNPMRRSIAEHMTTSLLHTAPHVTTVFECDMTAVLKHRRQHREDYAQRGIRLTLTAYIVSAAAEALSVVPQVNSRFHGDSIELISDINIGLGTALGDDGLVVPVVHNADTLDLGGIARELQTLTEKARDRKLTAADMQGGTFTISNHGVSGSLLAAPIIINQPQSAILGVGALSKQVVVKEIDGEDVIRIAPMCYITLTLDHRVLDAHQANGFLRQLVDRLENWGGE